MKSNRTFTRIYKYTFLGLTIISILFGLLGFFFPNVVTISGQKRQLDETELLISLIIGFIFLAIFFTLKHKFVELDLAENKITINDFNQVIEIGSTEIEAIQKLPFIKPPLYKLKLKNNNRTYLFTTQPKFFRVGNSSVDTSEMGTKITEMKKELRI